MQKISIQVTTSIAAVATCWDQLLPAEHHLKAGHLASFEKAAIDDINTYYVQIIAQDELVGVVYLQQFNFQHKHLNFDQINTGFASLLKVALPSGLSLLVCGHLFRINYPGYFFRAGQDPSVLFEAIDMLIRQQQIKPCGIVIKDCRETLVEQNCRLSGYYFFNGDVTMEVRRRVHWHNFDDYLQDLKKDYFKRAKKIIRSFKEIETIQLNAVSIMEESADIERLYWNVVNKQTVKLGTVNARYFYELKLDLADRFEFHALYFQGNMVGFYTFIFNDTDMESHYIGLDYGANKYYKLYFNMLYAGIGKLIEKGYDTLELGRTAREAKVNLGAVPRQIVNYIKVRNPLVKMVLNYVLKKFNQSQLNEINHRNPLK